MTAGNIKTRTEIINEIQKILEEVTRKPIKICSFGSTSNGFGHKTSDLDICITNNEYVRFKKGRIVNSMRRSELFSYLEYVGFARVPIIIFKHRSSSIEGDLSFSNQLGISNTFLLYKYSLADDRVAPLVFSVKRFVKSRGLVGVPDYISSYSYTLMVIYFLQQLKIPVLPCLQSLHSSKKRPEEFVDGYNIWFQHNLSLMKKDWKYYKANNENIGELLVHFFEFYTNKFDYKRYSVCISNRKKHIKKNTRDKIHIRDPFEKERNLSETMSYKNFKHMLNCFKEAHTFFCSTENINDIEKFFLSSNQTKQQ